jgi:predicted metal-dependent phosphoesterase TrpH
VAVDLHLHSSASDGGFTPSQVVEHAVRIGLRCIALTDHDTVSGIAEAEQRAKELSILFIPGVELTVTHEGQEIHILGYFIDPSSPGLLACIEEVRGRVFERMSRIVKRISRLGYPLEMEEVVNIAGSGSMGRPHIARAMVEKGYVQSNQEAFDRFIGSSGPAYVEVTAMAPQEGYKIILEAGGIPAIAHPGYLGRADMMLEPELFAHREWGAMAIEVYHTRHDRYMRTYYTKMARKLEMAITGGSDCHGTFYQHVLMGRCNVPDWVADELFALRRQTISRMG